MMAMMSESIQTRLGCSQYHQIGEMWSSLRRQEKKKVTGLGYLRKRRRISAPGGEGGQQDASKGWLVLGRGTLRLFNLGPFLRFYLTPPVFQHIELFPPTLDNDDNFGSSPCAVVS